MTLKVSTATETV